MSREEQSPLSAATDCPATGSRCTSSVVLHPHQTSHNATSTSAHLLTDLAIPKRAALAVYVYYIYESAATRRRTLRGNGMKTQPHIMIAGPREMRIICTRVSYSVCVFLDVRLVAQFARAECVLIITYVMSARAFHARFNFWHLTVMREMLCLCVRLKLSNCVYYAL